MSHEKPSRSWSAACLCFAFLTSVFLGGPLHACKCAPPSPPLEALDDATAVFLAEVVASKPIQLEQQEWIEVTMRVSRWWKGGDAAKATVVTAASSAACGYDLRQGQRYLVYAHTAGGERPLRVSLCSRTRTETEAEASGDFASLPEGEQPAQ